MIDGSSHRLQLTNMSKMKQLIEGKKKYFALFGVAIILVIISGIISPIAIDFEKKDWSQNLEYKIENVYSDITTEFRDRQTEFLFHEQKLNQSLSSLSIDDDQLQTVLISEINCEDYSDYTIGIYDSSWMLLAWTQNDGINSFAFQNSRFQYGETFFLNSDLITYLIVVDTLNTNDNSFYLVFAEPFEKAYTLENDYYTKVSFASELTSQLFTQVEIDYSADAGRSKDGRKYSFDLMNNFNNKIAVVTFQKPNRDVELNNLENSFDAAQSIFTLLAIVFLGMGLIHQLNKVNSRLIRFVLLSSYIFIIRIVAFFFNIPSRFITGEIVDSAYFSSTFAAGLVRSPLEFFISGLTVLATCLLAYNFTMDYLEKDKAAGESIKTNIRFYAIAVLFTAVYLILLRGFGASVKSVIFDSTLRYFKQPTLSFDSPTLLMQMNLFILGFCSVVSSVVLILLAWRLNVFSKVNERKYFIAFFIIVQLLAYIYDIIQSQPQGTPLIRVLHIVFVFLAVYFILYLRKRTLFNHIAFALFASIISINLLIFYNADVEKESLKTTASEITRLNEGYLNFIVYETLYNITGNELTREAFLNAEENFNSVAFVLWSNSALQRETIGSVIRFYDTSMMDLGSFQFQLDRNIERHLHPLKENTEQIVITVDKSIFTGDAFIRGIAPIKYEDELYGFVEVTVKNEINLEGFQNIPDFLLTRRAFLNSTVDFSKIKIFDFRNKELKSYHADIMLTDHESNQIVNANFTTNNEAWLTIPLHDIEHLIYCLRIEEPAGERIVAVALQERDLSWSLFDFFKIFFIHIILIVALLIFIIAVLFWQKKINYISFKNKLLAAFLLISIIPLLLLAVYFSVITEEKNQDAISYKLGKRAVNVESYVSDYLNSSDLNLPTIFQKVERDLGVNFSIYKGGYLNYSTENQFYNIGLFPKKLNPIVYDRIYNSGYKEYILHERTEKFEFSSYYYLGSINGNEAVIQVSDVFNKITLPLSDLEMDTFIFSTYSLAALLIILISTILANQISSPIIRLTKATKAVAGGDLNLELTENYHGEVKGLVDSFNIMVRQLKKSQSDLALMERETAWKEMAKQVAHEIKNPLTPMKLSVQQLIAAYKDKSPKFDSIFERVTNTIISQIETLRNIASEFSSFARMPGLHVEMTNMVNIAQDAVNLFLEEKAEIVVNAEIENAQIMADTEQLKRTIINLIRNSLQASAVKIYVAIKQNGDEYLLRISDNGTGIPSAIADKVFDEEFTTKEKGMGLGLSMSQRFVSSVNGSIEIENTSPEGTTILLTFPKAG